MTGIWGGAKRGEGYQIAGRHGKEVFGIEAFIIFCVIVGRFYSGRPMRGPSARKTNATFVRPGTELLYKKARPPFRWPKGWNSLPEWKRGVIRTICQCETILFPLGHYNHSTIGIVAYSAAWSVVVIWASWACAVLSKKSSQFRHNKKLIGPLQKGLAPIFGISAEEVEINIPPLRRVK